VTEYQNSREGNPPKSCPYCLCRDSCGRESAIFEEARSDSVLTGFDPAFPCVSTAFPRQETGFSAYLSGIWPSVSAFPSFPSQGRGIGGSYE
jgi:hypothetical protein